jgi:hypothetical protein
LVDTTPKRTDLRLALMGGLVRRGAFTLARRILGFALIGGADIDLTEATWPDPPEVTITKISLVGGCAVTVPAGTVVDTRSFSIVGGTRQEGRAPTPEAAAGRAVHVRSIAVVGGIRVRWA